LMLVCVGGIDGVADVVHAVSGGVSMFDVRSGVVVRARDVCVGGRGRVHSVPGGDALCEREVSGGDGEALSPFVALLVLALGLEGVRMTVGWQ